KRFRGRPGWARRSAATNAITMLTWHLIPGGIGEWRENERYRRRYSDANRGMTMLGPLIVDVEGTQLTAADRELLRHPLVGGVILFARNTPDADTVAALAAEIHALRRPQLLVTMDQEGGRVQRLREGVT